MSPVQIPGYQQQGAYPSAPVDADPWDLVEGGGGIPAVKFGHRDQYDRFIPAEIGTRYSGILVEDLVKNQVIDYETKEAKTWKDGSPVMQVVATVQLDPGTWQPEDDEDTGIRRIFFKSGALTAFQTEVRERKIPKFGPGTRITIELIGFKPPKTPGYNPSNVFNVTIGPEFVPWVDPAQRAVDETIGFAPQIAAAAQAGFPTQAQLAMGGGQQFATPQVAQQPVQQYAEPQQPAFPGQVVPPAQPPAQAAPQGVTSSQAAFEAIMAQAVGQPQTALPIVAQEDIDALQALVRGGVPLDQATNLYAQKMGKGTDFVEAAVKIIGNQQ